MQLADLFLAGTKKHSDQRKPESFVANDLGSGSGSPMLGFAARPDRCLKKSGKFAAHPHGPLILRSRLLRKLEAREDVLGRIAPRNKLVPERRECRNVTLHRANGQPFGLMPAGGVDLQYLLRRLAAILRCLAVVSRQSFDDVLKSRRIDFVSFASG